MNCQHITEVIEERRLRWFEHLRRIGSERVPKKIGSLGRNGWMECEEEIKCSGITRTRGETGNLFNSGYRGNTGNKGTDKTRSRTKICQNSKEAIQ